MVIIFIFLLSFLLFLLRFKGIIQYFIVCNDKSAVHLHEVVIVVSITILIILFLNVALQLLDG